MRSNKMKKNFIPKSAFVGFILGALIAAVTFIFFEELGIFSTVLLVPIILFAPIVRFEPIVTIPVLYIWIAAFCIIGGLVAPVVFSAICTYAGESTKIKAKKICNIIVTFCFAPYLIFALIAAVVLLCFPVMAMADKVSLDYFTVLLFTLAAVILLLPKPKFGISREVGCTVLITALVLHMIFILSIVFGSDYYGADTVCILFYIVCVANLVIIRIFEQMPMHTLPRILLSLMCGVSCLYSVAFSVNSAFNSSTDFTLITIFCGAVALIYFIYRAVKINRTKYVAEQSKT